ncbi:extracellular electron transfer flavoprotein PplA [Sporolactobacillus sp. THM19-2]|uniref:extracellular electron transfer flavoprotein PplA n=1 Tax=Sporolactobacillus sp. THM19-2 TaxID=2511171 RepID=UPI001021E0EB|nr:extracellular electron transfer flavoprotein PplA [Sporolactobacillus sp. THM19-2]RYL92428.1 FMN-binding protein [Sporolactobacillus sp. THM19-2]
MKMKKLALTGTLLFTMILASCGSNENADTGNTEKAAGNSETSTPQLVTGAAYQDGTYSLNEKDFDKHGWKAQFKMTVKDGKITKSDYDYVNKDGALKSEDKNYEKAMKAKSGTGPKEYIPKLNKSLVDSQSAQQVEAVSGATESSGNFMNYAQQLTQAAQKGDTTPIQVDAQGTLKDGEYKLSEKNLGPTGWKTYIKMTVKGGKITKVDYNFLDKNNKLKSEDKAYEKKMKAQSGTGPQEYIPELSQSLKEKQNAGEVDVVTGATHSSHAFKIYAAQLINAAQKGDTTPIVVDNQVYKEEK